jgi:gliding motility-associated-like protein
MIGRIFFFLFTIACSGFSYGQGTTLNRGDLAVLAVNANYNAAKDEISFVCFKDITNGTEIQILDAGYENCIAGQWSCGQEGGAKMVRTGGTIPAGTVMTFRTDPVAFVYPDANWSVTDLFTSSNANYSVLSSNLNINAGGDQIYFAQGGVWAEQSTLCTINGNRTSPNVIYPGNNGRVLFGFSTNGWSSFQQSSSESGLYPGMQCFSMSPTGGTAYNKYTGPLTTATQTAWIARISSTSNWTTYSSTANYYSASPVYNIANFTIPITAGGGIPTATWTAPSSPLCSDGASINLNSLITGTTGGTWSGTGVSGNTFNPTGLNGNYDVTYTVTYVSGGNNCPIAQTNTITVVQVAAPTVPSPTIGLCQNGASTTLTATGSNLLWYTPSTGSIGSSTAPVPSTLSIGSTNYFVSQTISGCESPKTIIAVSVKPNTNVNAVSNQLLCASTSTAPIALTGTSNTVFTWLNDNISIGLAPAGGGIVIPSFTAFNNGTTAVTANITVTPMPVVYAYVANYGVPLLNPGNVSVVNTATNTVVSNITTGSNPFGVSVNPDGSKVLVTNFGSNTVSVISTVTNTVIATITVGSQPMGIVASPDGSKVYVVNQGSLLTPGIPGTLSVIDAATNTVIATVTLALQPQGVCISPDGSKVYVANVNSNNVSVINTTTNTVSTVIGVGIQPITVTIAPDGNRLYVPNFGNNNVSVINTATNAVIATVNVGTNPNGAAISPDGSKVYITNQGSSNISIINTATNTVTSPVAVGTQPQGASFTSDGTKAYIANFGSNNVSVINTTTNAVINTVTVGTAPHSLGNFIMPAPCTGPTITFTITVNPKPSAPVVTTQPSCSAPTGSITVSSPIGTGITYSIDGTNFQSSPTFNNLSANTYTVTVKNASGCTNTGTATVNPVSATIPAPTFIATQPTCSVPTGSITVVSPIGATLQYSIDGTNFQYAESFSNIAPGNYTLTVKVGGGCSNTSPFTIDAVPNTPAAPTVTSPISYCQNSTAAPLTATGSNLLWYTSASGGSGSTTAPIPPTSTVSSTTYHVSQSTNGCESVRTSLTVDIIAAPPAPTILANGATSFCEGGSVTLTSSTAINIQWYKDGAILNGSTNPNYMAMQPGVYTVSASSTNNCTASSAGTTVSIFPSPVLLLSPNVLVNENDSAKLMLTASQGNLFTYLWTPTVYLNDATVAQPWTKPLMDTYYTVTVTNENGCTATANTTVTVLKEIIVPNAFSPNGDHVNDTWEIPNLSSNAYSSVEVFARNGQLVYTSVGYTKPWDGTYKGKPVPIGVYYYIINLKNGKPVKSGNVTLLR